MNLLPYPPTAIVEVERSDVHGECSVTVNGKHIFRTTVDDAIVVDLLENLAHPLLIDLRVK